MAILSQGRLNYAKVTENEQAVFSSDSVHLSSETKFGRRPRTVMVPINHNVPKLFDLLLIVAQHRKVSCKDKRKELICMCQCMSKCCSVLLSRSFISHKY